MSPLCSILIKNMYISYLYVYEFQECFFLKGMLQIVILNKSVEKMTWKKVPANVTLLMYFDINLDIFRDILQ